MRSQINIQMKKIEGVEFAEGLRDILLPLVWFSDELDKITDPVMIEKIKAQL